MDKLALMGGPKTVTAPQPSYPIIGADEVCAAVKVMMSGHLSDCGRGEFVQQMEDDFARYFGAKHALSFGSGTAAIHSGLFAVGVRPGSEVLTANHTWVSAITAICHAGAVPVFCDVKPGSLHIDPAEIRRKAGRRTKAVIVTHIWGIPADMDPILAAAKDMGLAVIEDCSHAHGAMHKGRLVGTFGDVGCFSLQGSKAIVAGEGGFLITDSRRLYQRAIVPGHHTQRLALDLTLKELQPFAQGGGFWTYRISPLGAAIAATQLKRLDAFNAIRQANFDRLHARLRKSVPFISWPKLARASRRGWYHTPAFYRYDQSKVPCAVFVRACQAEGVRFGREGYPNWYQIPVFQDLKLYSQLWPVKHTNGAAYKPVPPGGLPNDEALRRELLIFGIPAVESLQLMDQTAAAVEKVAANMGVLAGRRRRG